MDDNNLLSLFRSLFSESITSVQVNSGYKLTLPFIDSVGDHIAIFVEPQDNVLILDDLGHTAGLLFQLGQHGRDSIGHQLIKKLSEAYDVEIDYNRGVLIKQVPLSEPSKILEFIKIITSIETILPEMGYQKREHRTGTRLGTILGREVKQLRLPLYVSRQVEIQGKNETWVADYKYPIKIGKDFIEVVIVTADLKWGEPREKAAHVVTLAVDVMDSLDRKDLRIVYDVGRNGNGLASRKAAGLIEDYQVKIGYKAYNYGDPEKKLALLSLLHQELSPLAWERGMN